MDKKINNYILEKGFTLVELIVVTVIIAIIATAGGLVTFQAANKQARDNRRNLDLEVMRSAMEVYRADCGAYPTSMPWGSQLVGPTDLPCKNNVYLQKIPQDPKNPNYTYKYVYGSTTYYLCSTYETLPTSVPQPTIDTICTGQYVCNQGATPPVGCRYYVSNP